MKKYLKNCHKIYLCIIVFCIIAFIESTPDALFIEQSTHCSSKNWSLQTKHDLEEIACLIEKYHPATTDTKELHIEFTTWLHEGFSNAIQMAQKVTSDEGYKFVLSYYIAGFRDGHFKITTKVGKKTNTWPGFLLSYYNGEYFVAHHSTDITDKKHIEFTIPPHNAKVICCNQKNPSLLMKSNIIPFVSDDFSLESSWARCTPLLLVDQENPWAEKINEITYLIEGKEYSYTLQYTEISEEDSTSIVEYASYGKKPGFFIREFDNNGIWISIPTFNVRERENLKNIVLLLPTFREKKSIVFDLRGNTGGSSGWVVEILKALYGEEYLGSLAIKNENAYADDYLSVALINRKETERKQYGWHTDEYIEHIKKSYNEGTLFLKRPIDVNMFASMKHHIKNVPNPVHADVYVLTDGHCFSSGLIFMDSILSIPNVIHIGTETNGDTKFSNPLSFDLSSGLSTLYIPTMIRRNWQRKNNESYIPTYLYSGFMGDTHAVEAWVKMIIAQIKN